MAENDTTSLDQNGPPILNPADFSIGEMGQALVPFAPVGFGGRTGLYAWARLLIYGGVALAAYPKSKKVSTVFGIAAGTSLISSLSADGWNRTKQK